ncbi:MAG: preprotein translocase subunit SecE [Anaerolineales bacterium]|nr:preprotein translocase subunit SecE [Anaerolineales bacterium]
MAGKDTKSKRENALARWWRETIGELRKVTWPTRQEALRLTAIVLVVMTGMAIFLFLVDRIATELLRLAIGN